MLDQIFVSGYTAVMNLVDTFVPEWLSTLISILLRIGAIATVAPAIMMYLTWFERKIIARIQNRLGPNRVGPYGLAQPLADGLKMLIKEDIVPRGADALLHFLGPVLAVVPAILVFAVIPFGRNMIVVDLDVGVLYVLAVTSISSYAIFIGGWASRSKFSSLGAIRSVAQIISYEVPSVLSVVVILMVVGSLSTVDIVEAQAHQWFIFTPWGFIGAAIFFLSGIAEVNRTPFDMPEAESELVGGFHTEYSGMKFALWYMGEFLGAFAVSAFTTTFFLGGWHGPALPVWPMCLVMIPVVATAAGIPKLLRIFGVVALAALTPGLVGETVPSWAWFLTKTYALVFVLVWLRGTFPRLRVDQLMGFAWKFLLPMALVNILAAGVWVMWPGLVGTALSVAMLGISIVVFIRLNSPAPLQSRRYVLVD